MDSTPKRLVTIDGPAGAGKTSVSRRAAEALGVAYLDTGAMFRALGLRLGEGGHALPEETIDTALAALDFRLEGTGKDTRLLVDGRELPDEARTETVGRWASNLAVLPVVRRRLRAIQQALGQKTPLLAEGRDMGTVVFPRAPFKFFLDAAPEVRAGRRVLQLAALGKPADYDTILADIRQRDDKDRNRAESPLAAADDAMVIDTSAMTEEDVFKTIVAHVEAGGASRG